MTVETDKAQIQQAADNLNFQINQAARGQHGITTTVTVTTAPTGSSQVAVSFSGPATT